MEINDGLEYEELPTKPSVGVWSVLEDVKISLFDARYTAPIVAILGIVLAYQITIAPYQPGRQVTAQTGLAEKQPLHLIRPQLSHEEMAYIHTVAMNMETEFIMPLPSLDAVKLRFHSTVSQQGTHNPPELFYQGVTFGLTHENPYNLEYTAQSLKAKKDLYSDLHSMNPRPTSIMNRTASYNSTLYNESGYAVYFSYADLAKQGKLSSDRRQPWKRVVEDILEIARDYKQIYITVWYPHSFGQKRMLVAKKDKKDGKDERGIDGKNKATTDAIKDAKGHTIADIRADATSDAKGIKDAKRDTKADAKGAKKGAKAEETVAVYDPTHRLEVVLQQIIPTRTGMTQVKSTATVWMSAVNQTDPHTFLPRGIHIPGMEQ